MSSMLPSTTLHTNYPSHQSVRYHLINQLLSKSRFLWTLEREVGIGLDVEEEARLGKLADQQDKADAQRAENERRSELRKLFERARLALDQERAGMIADGDAREKVGALFAASDALKQNLVAKMGSLQHSAALVINEPINHGDNAEELAHRIAADIFQAKQTLELEHLKIPLSLSVRGRARESELALAYGGAFFAEVNVPGTWGDTLGKLEDALGKIGLSEEVSCFEVGRFGV